MNLRWLLGNFVPRQHGMGWREEHDVSWQAHEKHITPARFWTWTLLAMILPAVVVFVWVLPALLSWMGLGGRNGPYVIGAAVLLLVFWVWSAWVYRFVYERSIRRALRERGIDLCVACGYSLTGLDDDVERCPECGAERQAGDP